MPADVPDHCQLRDLTSDAILENTRTRYARDVIYTYVGAILVAVNPFKHVARTYGVDVMKRYRGQKRWNAACGPHPYATAEAAFVAAISGRRNQVIIVSGESGSGKTETNKHLMEYVIWRGGSSGSGSGRGGNGGNGASRGTGSAIGNLILAANPILEAVGNAKTLRNHNSSRFGRYVVLRCAAEGGAVISAPTRVYLLEHSRLTSADAKGERSFHVLYMLVASRRLVQCPPEAFRYLSLSGTTVIEGVDDARRFGEFDAALGHLTFSEDERECLYGMLLAVLRLGNLGFGSTAEASRVDDEGLLGLAEGALGAARGAMRPLLERRTIVVREATPFSLDWPRMAWGLGWPLMAMDSH